MCKDVIQELKNVIKMYYELTNHKQVDKKFNELQADKLICYEAWG